MKAVLAFFFPLALASTAAPAETIQQCQDRAKELQSHAVCGQGDLACLNRLENELKDRVGKTCEKALEDLKPQPSSLAPETQSSDIR